MRSPVTTYAVALAALAVAVLARWLLDQVLASYLPLVTLFGAVAVAVWIGGYRPALLVVAFGYLACAYLFMPPRGSFGWNEPRNLVGLIAYLVTCIVIIGLGEAMRVAQRRALEGQELLRVTFASIGDAVITTDTQGRITYLNAVAESLTGWKQQDAVGQPLDMVFRIINEQTRQPAENPVAKALREGVIIGLANHTLLLTKDGAEKPIDDSAAPIRASQGHILGCVLIFRDITARRQAEEVVRAETAALTRLNDASSRLWRLTSLREGLDEMLAVTIEMLGAAMGNIQILDPERGLLIIAAQRGFKQEFLHFFREVSTADDSACGRALRSGQRIVIEDVEVDELYAPMRPIARAAGYRAVQSTPLIDRNGKPLGMFSTHFRSVHRPSEQDLRRLDLYVRQAADFIERFRTDEALRESEARFRTLADATPVLIWLSGTDKLYTWFNKRWLDFVGRPMERELGNGWAENVHPDDFDRCLRIYTTSFDSRQPFTMEYRLRRHDGEYRWVLDHGIPLHEPGGEFTGYIGSCIDITDRQRAEQELADAEVRVRAVLNHVIDGIITIDDHGSIESFNPAAAKLFGYKAEEVMGKNIKLLMPEPYCSEHDGYLANYLQTGKAKIIGIGREVVGRRKDGSTFPMDLAVSEFRLGQCRYFTGIVRDITEKKQLEQELHERAEQLTAADRRKDQFLATLAHELRNPLAPIRNAVHILLARDSHDPDMKWGREVIDRQVKQMSRLLDDLLDVSRISRNRLELRKERIELAEVVQCAVETSRPHIDSGGHELNVVLPPGPVYLDADPVRLAQVFSNLLNNAAKYTEKGGHIRLHLERQGSDVVVSVQDDGIGIAAEMLPRLFDIFSQSTRVLERSQGGLGIGLSLVRGLVELHGGRIEAKSAGPGKGSEFIVRLPVIVEKLVRESASGSNGGEPESAPGRRLLVVDDLKDSADSLSLMLKAVGHEVCTAYDGEEAIAAAERFKPEVILLDIGMPKLNGYDACRHIRKQPWSQGMVLIALTGWGQEDDRRRTEDAGFDHHLVKPVEPTELLKLLASLQVPQLS